MKNHIHQNSTRNDWRCKTSANLVGWEFAPLLKGDKYKYNYKKPALTELQKTHSGNVFLWFVTSTFDF